METTNPEIIKAGKVHPNYFLVYVYYLLPYEAVGNNEFSDIPRRPRFVLDDPKAYAKICGDRFLLFMQDMVANMLWPYIGRRGWIETYSGYSPAYTITHMLNQWRNVVYTVFVDSLNPIKINNMNPYFPWITFERSSEIWKLCVELMKIACPKMRNALEIEKQYPCFEDFDLENQRTYHTRAYIDFLRKWTHAQTKHPTITTDRMPSIGIQPIRSVEFRLDYAAFLKQLSPEERMIIRLRLNGNTMQQVADRIGCKTHSAVVKRLKKIRDKYQAWFSLE